MLESVIHDYLFADMWNNDLGSQIAAYCHY